MDVPEEPTTTSDDFASGTSGQVSGIRATSRALVSDAVGDAFSLALCRAWRLRRAARRCPRRRILVMAIERTDQPNVLAEALAELVRSRHDVRFATRDAGSLGKFQNLNRLLADHPAQRYDWTLVLDDDVALPRGFLDGFIFLAECSGLRLAQPAHRSLSHAAWQVTRRQPRSVVRETHFVETGPVVGFHSVTFALLLPFPDLRFGWGLDLHWSALAGEQGWPIGVVDATPVRHRLRQVAAAYDHGDAMDEARHFLSDRGYTRPAEAQRTVRTYTTWTRIANCWDSRPADDG